jgi:MFS family permease
MTRDLKILGLSVLIWGLGDGMIFYFQPLYLTELGADPSLVGGVLGIGALLMALTQIPAGMLSDRIGRKNLLITAWLIGLLATVVMYLATTLTSFVLGLWLLFIAGFMFAPMASYISASDSPWGFTRSLTTISALYAGGTIVGPLIGGQIAVTFNLRTVYFAAIFAPLISTITLVFLSPQPVGKTTKATGFKNYRKNVPLLRFLSVIFIALLAMFISWPLTPVYLQEVRSVSVGTIGILGSLNALGVVVLNLIIGRVKSRQGILISTVLVTLSVIFIWRGAGSVWFGLGYFLAAGYRLCRVLVTGHTEAFVTLETSGLGYGIAETVGILSVVVASPISGFLYEIDPELPFPISLALLTFALILILTLIPRESEEIKDLAQADIVARKESA